MSASRDLRLLSGAVLLSAGGDLLMVVVLSLRVHDLTGSGFAVAAVFATLMAPVVLLAPLAGRLVDRTETRRLLRVFGEPNWPSENVSATSIVPRNMSTRPAKSR